MLFNSWQFILFFPTVVVIYYLLQHRHRWMFLLAASYFFYMCWKPAYLILILTSTLIDYLAGLGMGRAKTKAHKRFYLVMSLVTNLGLLFSFKYFNFFNDSLRALFGAFSFNYDIPALNVLLPVGISFYTFQTLSYTIEVYRGTQKPEKHLGIFALYVSYFPQLVAGRIERPGNLLNQFKNESFIEYDRVVAGLRQILWGLFKKVVIADRLALAVDAVYNDPQHANGPAVAIATVFFAFQIYCDFSGYSDIAIGAAKVLGHKLMKNFDRPYLAASIKQFWQRWHISLSTWFKDYLYIPLGGSRAKISRLYLNLFIVFTVSGLWHGASWTFVIWGALHGFFYIFAMLTKQFRTSIAQKTGIAKFPRVYNCLQIITTFTLVCFAWIFFRANSLPDTTILIGNLFNGWLTLFAAGGFDSLLNMLNISSEEFLISAALIILLFAVQHFQGEKEVSDIVAKWNRPLRWVLYISIVLIMFNLGISQSIPFIYFQF